MNPLAMLTQFSGQTNRRTQPITGIVELSAALLSGSRDAWSAHHAHHQLSYQDHHVTSPLHSVTMHPGHHLHAQLPVSWKTNYPAAPNSFHLSTNFPSLIQSIRLSIYLSIYISIFSIISPTTIEFTWLSCSASSPLLILFSISLGRRVSRPRVCLRWH